jgi:hypothetical protein
VAKWEALAPIPVSLENETLSYEDITVTRYDENELDNLLEDDKDYWPHVNFDLDYKSGYWLKLDRRRIKPRCLDKIYRKNDFVS